MKFREFGTGDYMALGGCENFDNAQGPVYVDNVRPGWGVAIDANGLG